MLGGDSFDGSRGKPLILNGPPVNENPSGFEVIGDFDFLHNYRGIPDGTKTLVYHGKAIGSRENVFNTLGVNGVGALVLIPLEAVFFQKLKEFCVHVS